MDKFTPPNSGSDREYRLIPPYIVGTGIDGTSVSVYYDGPLMHPGSIFRTDKDDLLRIDRNLVIEDLFENYNVLCCQLVTNNPAGKVDPSGRMIAYMYSTANA